MRIVYIYTAVCTKGDVDCILTAKTNYLAEQPEYEVYLIADTFCPEFPFRRIRIGIDRGYDATDERCRYAPTNGHARAERHTTLRH
jgi:hypothetical protein